MSVKLSAAAAVLVLVAAPIAVQGEPAPAKAPSARRVCTTMPTLGTRLGNVRRCRTQEEREQEKQEARQVVDRVQAFKPTMCAPPRPAC